MEDKIVVTPWEVSGSIDYEKLIKMFGVSKITQPLKESIYEAANDKTFFLSRDVYFSHRDFDIALSEYKDGSPFYLYMGRGPSGHMHIGHLMPFIFTKWLQDRFGANLYIQITDDEKFLIKESAKMEDIESFAAENIMDLAAVGFNPDKTFIFKDTEYIRNIYGLATKIAKKITFSMAKATFGFTPSTNTGMVFFPAIEIVPTMFEENRCVIPSPIDQDPYWRIARDISESLGHKKSAQLYGKFLPPLTGVEGKMSASKPETAIYLNDSPEAVEKKVNKYAFSGGRDTVELHRKLGGNPDIDVSFMWLRYFFEPDDKKLKSIEDDYRSGKMLTGELKAIVIEKINRFLAEHRKKREDASKVVDSYMYTGRLAKKMWETFY